MIRSAKKLPAALLCGAVASCAFFSAGTARGEIPLVDPTKTDGWEVTSTGRVDSYFSYIFGDTINTSGTGNSLDPADPQSTNRPRLIGPQIAVQGSPVPNGAIMTGRETDLNTMRVRGGFASTIVGLNVYKQLTPNVKLIIKTGMWAGIQNGVTGGFRSQNDVAQVDFRDQFMRLEGPWGAVWGGRLVGLFNRGGMRMNWFLMHREGVGHPCSVDSTSSATCGHTGVGNLHPMRNGQLGASTPEIGGFQLSLAILDPSMIDQVWNRTLYPRVETELTYRLGKAGGDELNVWGNGMYQIVGRVAELAMNPMTGQVGVPADATRNVYGYGGGVWGRTHGFGLGATGWAGMGLGTAWAFGNTAVDENGVLRQHFGYLAIANYRLGGWEVAVGYGSSNVRSTVWDSAEANPNKVSVVKEVRGISGKIAYHLGPVAFSIDAMNIRNSWHRGEVLTANVINAGMLAEW